MPLNHHTLSTHSYSSLNDTQAMTSTSLAEHGPLFRRPLSKSALHNNGAYSHSFDSVFQLQAPRAATWKVLISNPKRPRVDDSLSLSASNLVSIDPIPIVHLFVCSIQVADCVWTMPNGYSQDFKIYWDSRKPVKRYLFHSSSIVFWSTNCNGYYCRATTSRLRIWLLTVCGPRTHSTFSRSPPVARCISSALRIVSGGG
ncbi:hypothetical protein DEU56DRAFT_800025 [Suillus clintonianus]|uniref:uncharacterized protein n=1 Tax=Suillus clintonianus TaxID=1904413 RepID=UPI001B869252|nr:uncharacterized protein DEU56DRAFT_800025 [Suillus clintonianus]KAG2139744.1 hypothetical protein DEU56DRAFT_800025 [Suillus clintonianus]